MKKLPRRTFLHLVAGATVLSTSSRIARAQTYPSRPVRIIVGFPAGGSSDIYARLIGQWLTERLGQQFVIDNRPGANANIATEVVVRSPADGQTLLLVGSYNTILYEKLNFIFLSDITPVAGIIRVPLVVVVHPSVPARTVPEFISYATANPGKLNMASAGIGNITHVAGELFKTMTGVNMLHVPYRGAAPALIDLIGGQVQAMLVDTSSSIGYIKAGKLRALAVTASSRVEAFPELPTVGDFVPGYEASTWYGIGAPRNTPTDIVAKINREMSAGLADLKLKARFAELGGLPMPMTPAEFGTHIATETEKWAKVIRAANIKAE
jgi:tripartite-type tricarboxylate transporter receptor subunit TctC